jgi:hypothetical protein
MSHRRLAVWLVLLTCTALVPTTPLSARPTTASQTIVVTTTAEFLAALAANAGETIFLQRGTYLLDQAIQVPDHTALVGEGEMLFDASGLPAGFLPETRTVIAAMPGVSGDFVSLGDGASLQGLVIQDVTRPGLIGGGVVTVQSRAPGDAVSVRIVECEIINPNSQVGGPAGPAGRALLVITRNPHFIPSGAPPHEQSRLSVALAHSITRAPAGGGGVFGLNNAGGSQIDLQLHQNVLGGLFNVAAGASRPDSVTGATLRVQSNGNLYRSDVAGATAPGWNLQGGADSNLAGAEETRNNALWVHSVDDRLEGFSQGIFAAAGRRNFAPSAPSSSNELDLILHGTRVTSTGADFVFRGASSIVAGTAAGDNNVMRVVMRHVIGSGPRANDYINSTANLGIGNQLLFTGTLNAFSRTNEAILPMPGAQFFTAER